MRRRDAGVGALEPLQAIPLSICHPRKSRFSLSLLAIVIAAQGPTRRKCASRSLPGLKLFPPRRGERIPVPLTAWGFMPPTRCVVEPSRLCRRWPRRARRLEQAFSHEICSSSRVARFSVHPGGFGCAGSRHPSGGPHLERPKPSGFSS